MRYRKLGKSPLLVSELCLGTMMFGDQTELAEARHIVDQAFEQGVNLIDTADVYSTGASEQMVGQLIKPRRHDWILATKLGNAMSQRVNEARYSRAWMLRACEASLQRLDTDHIDIYYLHKEDHGTPLGETVRALSPQEAARKLIHLACEHGGDDNITAIIARVDEVN